MAFQSYFHLQKDIEIYLMSICCVLLTKKIQTRKVQTPDKQRICITLDFCSSPFAFSNSHAGHQRTGCTWEGWEAKCTKPACSAPLSVSSSFPLLVVCFLFCSCILLKIQIREKKKDTVKVCGCKKRMVGIGWDVGKWSAARPPRGRKRRKSRRMLTILYNMHYC